MIIFPWKMKCKIFFIYPLQKIVNRCIIVRGETYCSYLQYEAEGIEAAKARAFGSSRFCVSMDGSGLP